MELIRVEDDQHTCRYLNSANILRIDRSRRDNKVRVYCHSQGGTYYLHGGVDALDAMLDRPATFIPLDPNRFSVIQVFGKNDILEHPVVGMWYDSVFSVPVTWTGETFDEPRPGNWWCWYDRKADWCEVAMDCGGLRLEIMEYLEKKVTEEDGVQ